MHLTAYKNPADGWEDLVSWVNRFDVEHFDTSGDIPVRDNEKVHRGTLLVVISTDTE